MKIKEWHLKFVHVLFWICLMISVALILSNVYQLEQARMSNKLNDFNIARFAFQILLASIIVGTPGCLYLVMFVKKLKLDLITKKEAKGRRI